MTDLPLDYQEARKQLGMTESEAIEIYSRLQSADPDLIEASLAALDSGGTITQGMNRPQAELTLGRHLPKNQTANAA